MQPCIIDSCSLLHAFHVQVGDSCLSDLVAEHFDVVLHRTVLEEMKSVLGRAYPRWRERALVSEEISEIRRNHAAWTSPKCSDANLDSDILTLEGEGLEDLDAGEMDCIALAKCVADQRVCYVLFLTDDFDAGESAKHVFDKYQCGMVIRSADLISFFGIRYKLARTEIHQGLRNLISFYTSLYDSLLSEVTRVLPGSESSYVYPLVRNGDFARAKQAVSRLSVDAATRSKLTALVDEVDTLAGEKSVLGHSLFRLRALDRLKV